MERSFPLEFDNLISSTLFQTDEIFFQLAERTTRYDRQGLLRWMEEAAQCVLRKIWKYVRVSTPPRLTLGAIIDKLSGEPSIKLLRDIVKLKVNYLSESNTTSEDVCSILTCEAPVYMEMNQMKYCKGHRGLAFIYGLRTSFRYSRMSVGLSLARLSYLPHL